MNARRAFRLRMSALTAAVVGLALFGNTPQSYGKLNMFWSAGFPFTYAHGGTGERYYFSIAALLVDIAIPAVVVMALGLIAWRSKISDGESEATGSEDSRPPLADQTWLKDDKTVKRPGEGKRTGKSD